MSDAVVQMLNNHLSPSVHTLGGLVTEFDPDSGEITMTFKAVAEFCHSEIIVQGGYITGMLDAAMALSVIGLKGVGTAVPTLELKVSFISPGNPGTLTVKARPVHLGKSTAFLGGELYQEARLVAAATSTAKMFVPA